MEIQPILALVAHRQIGEDEVASLLRAIEICDTRDRHTCQDGRRLGRCASSLGDDTGVLQARVQDEIGIVAEGDVCPASVVVRVAIEDVQLDYRRRIDWATVGRRCQGIPISFSLAIGWGGRVHFCPAPHALARSGCCLTCRRYLSFLPSRVILVLSLSKSRKGGRNGVIASIVGGDGRSWEFKHWSGVRHVAKVVASRINGRKVHTRRLHP